MATSLVPPDGAVFEYEPVKTDSGTRDLGEVPILVWKDANAALNFYGAEGIANILDGTSLRVSFQGIARRGKAKNEDDDAIAKKQIEFRPGKRAVGESTPVSRAAKSARGAAEALGGDGGDILAAFLARVQKGEISRDQLGALLG